MARLLSPSGWFAAALDGNTFASSAGTAAVVYADAAGTTLADIRTYDGSSTPGAAIAGSTLTVDSNSSLPRFWLPDGANTVWVKVGTGPLIAVDGSIPVLDGPLGTVLNHAVIGNPIATVTADALVTTTPSVTLSNGRAFKVTVRGQVRSSVSQGFYVRLRRGSTATSPVIMDPGWLPPIIANSDSFFQVMYEFTNTSGSAVTTPFTVTMAANTGTPVEVKGFTSTRFQVRIEDIGPASKHTDLTSI